MSIDNETFAIIEADKLKLNLHWSMVFYKRVYDTVLLPISITYKSKSKTKQTCIFFRYYLLFMLNNIMITQPLSIDKVSKQI